MKSSRGPIASAKAIDRMAIAKDIPTTSNFISPGKIGRIRSVNLRNRSSYIYIEIPKLSRKRSIRSEGL